MSVDKFGRPPQFRSDSSGVSISYTNNNFLRRDGTNTATGSINMTGNTLTNVSNPVIDQDVATKNYVDSNVSVPAVTIVTSGSINLNDTHHYLLVDTTGGNILFFPSAATIR